MKTAAQLVADDADVDLRDYFLKGGQQQPRARGAASTRRASTSARYLDAIEQYDIVFGVGPAGTGKTYLAMAQAVSYLLAKKVSRIILARPAVEAGEKLGFLPGDLQEKVNPYLRPLYDALYDMMDTEKATRLLERGTIEVAPIAFMRGRTLNDAFVILDEAQNTTSEQMKMFLTRLGLRLEGGGHRRHHADRSAATRRMSGLVEALEDRQGRRGHRLRLLRRPGRRPPQAGAADRQGVRGLLDAARVRDDQTCRERSPVAASCGRRRDARRALRAPGLARWLAVGRAGPRARRR